MTLALFVETLWKACIPVGLGLLIEMVRKVIKEKDAAHLAWMERINSTDQKIDALTERLNKHMADSEERDIRNRRTAILDFANSCMNGRKHTQEEFEFIISECDLYEHYCEENNIQNGVADVAIAEIKRIYQDCRVNHSFLLDGILPQKS